MAEYLNDKLRDILKKTFAEQYEKRGLLTAHHTADYLIKHDVIEVVRCKDCDWANEDGTICHRGVGRDTEPMGYCHNGLRKGEE